MNRYCFNEENIKTFKFKDLDEKTLKIKTIVSVDGEITVGMDIEDGNVYVLNLKTKIED